MKLHANVLGEGQPFLILHGFLGMSDNWKSLGNKFAENGYEVHLIDQRNHGKSPHSDEFSYNLMAEDIKEYCQENNLENIILLGHSMGGKTAMFTAGLYPGLVKKLIVADIAPKYYAPHHQEILKGLTALEEEEINSRGEAEDYLAEFVKEKGIRLFLLKNLDRKGKNKYALKLNLDALKSNIDNVGEALPEEYTFDEPTLFIKGEKSGYISREDEQIIQKQFPESKIVEIKGAGHWLHAEQPEKFYTTVMNLL